MQPRDCKREILTSMHSPQHAGNELVDTITLLHERDQGRDPAFVIGSREEMREDQLLERINLVLKVREIVDGLITNHIHEHISNWV